MIPDDPACWARALRARLKQSIESPVTTFFDEIIGSSIFPIQQVLLGDYHSFSVSEIIYFQLRLWCILQRIEVTCEVQGQLVSSFTKASHERPRP